MEPAVKERGSVKRAVGEFDGFDGDFDGEYVFTVVGELCHED